MRTAAVFLLAGLARAACIPIPSARILARDLAPSVPLFARLNPEEVLGFAPFPGTVRTMSSRDVLFTARNHGLDFPPDVSAPSICVERVVHHLSEEQVREALLTALDRPNVRLEVLEFSNQSFPPGRLEFDFRTLNRPPGNDWRVPVTWRGRLVYDDRKSLNAWAKVRISVETEAVLAREDISQGSLIRGDQIATVRIPQFPSPGASPLLASAIAGKIARRTIAAGQPIPADAVDEFQEVTRGQTIHVEAIDGGATIRFDGIAQASGRKGDVIVVHNPWSGRSFRARIEGPEQVVVRGEL